MNKANENIKFIKKIIKDRDVKGQPTFYVIKLDNGGSITPMTGREEGKSFEDTITEYLLSYPNATKIVELYTGKSPSVKGPFDTKYITPDKNTEVSLSGVKTDLDYSTIEQSISPDKYIASVIERERKITELTTTMLLLERERDELKAKNKKKKKRIAELETEIEKQEKAQKKSIANVTLGGVASNALESFAKSDFGIGLLKNVFGAKQEVLNGLMGIEEEEKLAEPKSKAKVVVENETEEKRELSKDEKTRIEILKRIQEFLKGSNDAVLRLYYQLIILLKDDLSTLQQIYTQVQAFKKKTPENINATKQEAETEEDEEKEEKEEKEEEEKETEQEQAERDEQQGNFRNKNSNSIPHQNPDEIDDT